MARSRETHVLHLGEGAHDGATPLGRPIYTSSTFVFVNAAEVEAYQRLLTPLYVKTLVQAAWMIFWRARKSVMTRWEISRARKRFRHRMISRLVRPSAVRRATPSTVG